MLKFRMFDWEDMRAFIAAAQGGSFNAAADKLGVDPATLSRRTARLESALKATLLTRTRKGLQLTTTGAQVYGEACRAAAALEAAADAAASDPGGGVVRLSVSEGFGTRIVAPRLPQFRRERPAIRIELVADPGLLSPDTYEVDLAVTLNAPASRRLHVEPLAEYDLGLFASADYLAGRPAPGAPADLMAHEIVGYIDDLIYTPELHYLEEVHPGLKPTVSSSSIRAQQAIVAAGGGVAILPHFLGEGLVAVLPDEVRLKRRFWISTRVDVRDVARIKSVRVWLGAITRDAFGAPGGASMV